MYISRDMEENKFILLRRDIKSVEENIIVLKDRLF